MNVLVIGRGNFKRTEHSWCGMITAHFFCLICIEKSWKWSRKLQESQGRGCKLAESCREGWCSQKSGNCLRT